MGSNPTHVDWVESMDLIIFLIIIIIIQEWRYVQAKGSNELVDLSIYIYIYIYIYICMYVCMYMCVHGSWGFFN